MYRCAWRLLSLILCNKGNLGHFLLSKYKGVSTKYMNMNKKIYRILSFSWGAIQGTFTTAVVSKSALNLLYYRKSPPGTIYYGKKSVRELFTADSEFILQVKTCSKGRNLLQGVYPVVNFFYG